MGQIVVSERGKCVEQWHVHLVIRQVVLHHGTHGRTHLFWDHLLLLFAWLAIIVIVLLLVDLGHLAVLALLFCNVVQVLLELLDIDMGVC